METFNVGSTGLMAKKLTTINGISVSIKAFSTPSSDATYVRQFQVQMSVAGDTSNNGRYVCAMITSAEPVSYKYSNWQFVDSDGTTHSVTFVKELSPYTTTLHVKLYADSAPHGSASTASALGEFNVVLTVPAMPSYTVTYDANGGSGAPASQQKQYGTALTLSPTKPSRTGYEFALWTGSDGNDYQPGDSYTTDASLTLTAVWGGQISFIGNGGGNVPKPISKPYNVSVRIPDNIPTKAGYIFLSWNTSSTGNGATYMPGSTVAASMNGSMILYAMWEKGPDAPTIRKLTAIRCDSQGVPNDDGTYCSVTCEWLIDTVNVSNNSGRVTGTIAQERGDPSVFAFSSGYTGTSGTAVALISNVDTDRQYTITVTVTDKNYASELSAILTRAKFILDFKAGGLGLGIGSAAPTTGVEIGWDVQFDGSVKVLGTLEAAGLSYSKSVYTTETTPTCTDVFSPNGSFSSDRVAVQCFGRVMQVNLRIGVTSADDVPAGSNHSVGQLASSICPSETISFGHRNVCGTISSGGAVNITVLEPWSSWIDVGVTYMVRR